MKSLRFRIAMILICAIVVVVAASTSGLVWLVTRPDPTRMADAVASQIKAMNTFDTEAVTTSAATAAERSAPAGPFRQDLTAALLAHLARDGVVLPVKVYDGASGAPPIAVATLSSRTVEIEFPTDRGPPAALWLVLGSWFGLIVVGVIGVSLVVAYRVTQPFVMLEQAVTSVGRDGLIPPIPEVGSGEARQTASALNRLSARFKSAMESRMRLVAAAGHDLRTPMTRMRIRVEFLPDEDRESWSRDIDELELIADSAIRLVHEEVSWGDDAPLALEQLLTETVTELQAQNYRIDPGRLDRAMVSLPRLSIQRALRNLLINAATHGRAGTVSLTAHADQVVIEIVDQGPGIPEDLLARVFEPFFRAAPGRLQTVPGAGLGLAIAKEIIERSGGELELCNGPAGGLVQTVRFRDLSPCRLG